MRIIKTRQPTPEKTLARILHNSKYPKFVSDFASTEVHPITSLMIGMKCDDSLIINRDDFDEYLSIRQVAHRLRSYKGRLKIDYPHRKYVTKKISNYTYEICRVI